MTIRKKSAARRFLEELSGPLTLGSLLAAIRQGEEWTQRVFAKKLKISVSELSDIERERKGVSAKRAAQFARTLGYSERQFVRLALQDSLHRQGMKQFQVHIEAA